MARRVCALVFILALAAACSRTAAPEPRMTAMPVRPVPPIGISPPADAPQTPGPGVAVTEAMPGSKVAWFHTPDRVSLVGRVFSPGRPDGIVFAHGHDEDMRAWFDVARRATEAGFSALAFDFRGYNQSSGTRDPSRYPLDVEAAIGFLETTGTRHIVVVGRDAGGVAAIPSGWLEPVDGIAAIGAAPRFENLDATEATSRYPVDVLLVAMPGDGSAELKRLLPDAELHEPKAWAPGELEALLLEFARDVVTPVPAH